MSVTLGFSWEGIKSFFAIKPRRQLREMYVFLLLFSFAASLIVVFEPIFFYTQGIPVWRIALYYALHYTLYVLLMPIGGMFAARFGYERSLTFSTPFFVLYFLVLAGLAVYPGLYWGALVILTVFKILYWPAYHANFASFSDAHNRGTEQSWVLFVEYGAQILGPLVGGGIAALYGFPVLFLLAAVTVGIAGFVLLRTKERSRNGEFSYTTPWRIIFSRQHRHMVVSMIGWGENLVYLAIWPIFLIIVFETAEAVGLVVSVSAFAATITGFIAGEVSDRISGKRLVRWVVPYMIVGYIFRMFIVWPWQVAVGDMMARTSVVGLSVPFISRLYRHARRFGPLPYSIAFEMVLGIVKAVLAFALVGVFLLLPLPTAFIIAFAIAAFLSLFYLVL